MTRLEPHEAKSRVGDDDPDRERATRQALAVNTVACVNQLRCFGDLVADLAAQAATSLRSFIAIFLLAWHGASDGTGLRFLTNILVHGRDAEIRSRDDAPYPPRG